MRVRYFEELESAAVDHYNKKADDYFVNFANPHFEKNKPFGNSAEAAMISYQIGLLFSGSKIGRAQTVLEIGSGAGWLASMIHRLGNEVFLLETSKTALQLAKELFSTDQRNAIHSIGPHFLHYDGYHIPLKDNSIDRVICFDALHHIPNPNAILAEIYRILTPNGIAGFAESGENHANLPAIVDCVTKTGILERSTSIEDIRILATATGFKKVTVKAFPLCSDWEIDISEYQRALAEGATPVDTTKIAEAHRLGDQTLFFLHKNHEFQFDCKYPNKPLTLLEVQQAYLTCKKGQLCTIDVTIKNIGDTVLNHEPHPLGGFATLGAHLLKQGSVVDYDFFHHNLSSDIYLNEVKNEQVQFYCPNEAGNYEIELDVIIEGVKWLQLDGAKTATITLFVK